MLISRGQPPGSKNYLDFCIQNILDFLGIRSNILVLPYATTDEISRFKLVQNALKQIECSILVPSKNPIEDIGRADAIFIPGGNTFRLLAKLKELKLLKPIKSKILSGMPYVGVSAGANIAGPTIKTTNDMPIIWPTSPKALNLVPFQINPHYLDFDPKDPPPGETRETRIAEYLEANNRVVVGLYGNNWLRIENDKVEIEGAGPGVRIFRLGIESEVFPPGTDVSFLIRN